MHGIFVGRQHPFVKTRQKKLNPLQTLAYFSLKAALLPFSLITGLLYMFPDRAADMFTMSLEYTALMHTAGAFLLFSFFIVHTYLTTTGGTLVTYITAMITGWEKIQD